MYSIFCMSGGAWKAWEGTWIHTYLYGLWGWALVVLKCRYAGGMIRDVRIPFTSVRGRPYVSPLAKPACYTSLAYIFCFVALCSLI